MCCPQHTGPGGAMHADRILLIPIGSAENEKEYIRYFYQEI